LLEWLGSVLLLLEWLSSVHFLTFYYKHMCLNEALKIIDL
jgi:hypothetical protein